MKKCIINYKELEIKNVPNRHLQSDKTKNKPRTHFVLSEILKRSTKLKSLEIKRIMSIKLTVTFIVCHIYIEMCFHIKMKITKP